MAANKKGPKASGKARAASGAEGRGKGGEKATGTVKGGAKGATSTKNGNPTKQSLIVKLKVPNLDFTMRTGNAGTTSSGRQTKVKQDADYAYDEEFEEAIAEYDDPADRGSNYMGEPSPRESD